MNRTKYSPPADAWRVAESETRIPIKSGARTIAYVQIGPNDADHAAVISASCELLAFAQRALPQLQSELEQRQVSGNDEEWKQLAEIVAIGEAALHKASEIV